MRISDWSSDVCSSDLAWFEEREAAKGALGAAFDTAVPAVELAAAGLPVRTDIGRLPIREWLRFGGVDLGGLSHWIDPALLPDRARKSVVHGKRVSVRVDLVGRRIHKKKTKKPS